MEIENISYKKKNKGGRFFFFVLTIACVGLCVLVSHFFASVITTGSVNFSNFSPIAKSSYNFYAVSLGAYATKTQAEEYATTCRAKNAAGFVWKKNGKYYVLASVYAKKNDADSVVSNLTTASFTPEIVEISIEKSNFSKASNNNLKKEYANFIENYIDIYTKLYDISVSLDTSVYTVNKARIEIDAAKTTFKTKLEKLNNGSSSSDGIYYLLLKNSGENIVEELSSLVEYDETATYPLGAKIKNYYITVLDEMASVISNIEES